MNIHNTIKSHIETLAAGEIITPKALLPFGSREAVDQVLSRLSKEGLISRVSRGVYCKPIPGRWGSYLPEAFAIAKSLSELHGEVIAPHGAVAVNHFQLSTQNPLQLVLLTTGRSKTVKLGWQTVRFQHVAASKLPAPNTLAGLAVTALHYLRENQEVTAENVKTIGKQLPLEERQRLQELIPQLPSWMTRALIEAKVLHA